MRADAASVEQKRVGHLVALRDQFAVRCAGVSMKKTFVDGVINDLDAVGRDAEKLFNLGPGKVRNREDSRCTPQHPLSHLQVPGFPESGLLACPRHVVQQVVNGHDVGARQKSRDGKKIGDVD